MSQTILVVEVAGPPNQPRRYAPSVRDRRADCPAARPQEVRSYKIRGVTAYPVIRDPSPLPGEEALPPEPCPLQA